MKKFINSALIASAVLAVGLVSCAKESGDIAENGNAKSVRLQITKENVAQGRAAGTHVGAVAVTMNDAYVYFTTATDEIMAYVQIDFATPNAEYGSNKVGYNKISATGGTEIPAIPGSVSKVYVVGNLPGGTYPTSGNISQFNTAAYIDVNSQYNSTDGGVSQVTLFGTNGLTAVVGESNTYTSSVEVGPICSRLEVGAVSASASSSIKSFTLDGIYINRYYPTMAIDGSAAGTLINNTTDADKYNAAVAGSAYASLDKIMSDYTTLIAQSAAPVTKYAPVASATDANVWAYNLLAPASANMPSIVIRISGVVLNNDDAVTYGGSKFLTVRNIYLEGSTTPLTELSKRNVYRIKNLEFSEEHLTTNPEMNSIDITVEAKLLSWVPNDVDYDFE